MKLNLIHAVQNEVEVTIKGDTGSEEVQRLLSLLHEDAGHGFIQINKSTLVNIHFVKSISAEFSGNYTATIKGRSETLTISRSYFKAFKQFVRG